MKITLQNVRSFIQTGPVEIKPLTFLVGENSSGKSTFLAALSAIERGALLQYRPQFNYPPYDLGSFDTIATYKGGKFGRATTFALGYTTDSEKRPESVFAQYRDENGQPVLASLDIQRREDSLSIQINSESAKIVAKVEARKKGPIETIISGKAFSELIDSLRGSRETIPLRYFLSAFEREKGTRIFESYPGFSDLLFGNMGMRFGRPIAIAPIRIKPRRTYDEIDEVYKPEGDHIPVVLSRILSTEDERKRTLVEILQSFGERSKLFKEVKAKRLGPRPSDPFQLKVIVAGREANIMDVGYGISQVLPILVESIIADPGRRITMQQPEVHLHPRAQAALGSFLVDMVQKYRKQFVIETHSDYIIDRVRQEVMAGRISPEKVSIIFFDKPKIETTLHTLTFDKQGNVLNAPPSYREFFMEEQISLLTGMPQ